MQIQKYERKRKKRDGEKVYDHWLRVAEQRPHSPHLSEDQFWDYFFGPDDLHWILIADDKIKGLLHLESSSDLNFLDFWVLEEDLEEKTIRRLTGRSLSYLDEGQKIFTRSIPGIRWYYDRLEEWNFRSVEPISPVLWKKYNSEKDDTDHNEGSNLSEMEPIHKIEPEQSSQIRRLAQLIAEVGDLKSDDDSLSEMGKGLKYDMADRNVSYWVLGKDEYLAYVGHETREQISGEQETQIEEVGVHPDHRERGLGKLILQEVLKKIRKDEIEGIYVKTHSKNPAKFLYKSCGFETVEEITLLTPQRAKE
ncbi:MAG: GNAT family N-acetyltransferase [Candidatus Thermoplasmatota archaeon]|nr:GNAT family N-acetyltransferase [Candidatus Thermoplasmatota archaeon]